MQVTRRPILPYSDVKSRDCQIGWGTLKYQLDLSSGLESAPDFWTIRNREKLGWHFGVGQFGSRLFQYSSTPYQTQALALTALTLYIRGWNSGRTTIPKAFTV